MHKNSARSTARPTACGAAKPAARRKPSTERESTRERILTAAKKIYRQHNFASVRTADITKASGTNIALVNYYFGSKNELFLQVFREACDTVARERVQALDALLARDPTPGTEALMRAWMTAVFGQTRAEDTRMLCSHLLGMVLASDINESIREVFGQDLGRVDARFAAAFHRARPDLSAQAIAWRMLSALGAYSLILGHTQLIELMAHGGPPDEDFDVQDELLRWLLAAMNAPANQDRCAPATIPRSDALTRPDSSECG